MELVERATTSSGSNVPAESSSQQHFSGGKGKERRKEGREASWSAECPADLPTREAVLCEETTRKREGEWRESALKQERTNLFC